MVSQYRWQATGKHFDDTQEICTDLLVKINLSGNHLREDISMSNPKWYLQRLRAMRPGEIVYRLRVAFRKRAWRKQVKQGVNGRKPHFNYKLLSQTPLDFNSPPEPRDAQALLVEAESYLQHEWHFFGLSDLREHPIDWHADPTSGKVAPHHFGFDINHRDESLVGNVKVTWEKNRHHHLTILAIAYALTKEDKYSAEVADQILDWIQQNPYLIGVNWTHPLEQGIRLMAWVWCERLLRGSENYERVFGRNSPVWASIYHHQEFIAKTHSRGSSANNHLIGEMAGLFIASTAWPIFDKSPDWQKLSHQILEQEIIKQTFPCGINRELAFSYHLFVLEFFILALIEAERAGIPFSDTYQTYVKRMLEVMPQLTDVGGNLPRYGDGDEGMAIQLQAHGERRDAWLYRVGRELLNAEVPVSDEGAVAAKLLGFGSPPSGLNPIKNSFAFEEAGLYVLVARRSTPKELFVLADAGPHGYLSIAAHAHADALSFTLSIGGRPILIDPGTYVYHTDWYWRRYFRSTKAHNTAVIDGLDQSTQAGPFLWTSKAKTTVHGWEVSDMGATLVAAHNGYARIGVTHQRRLELDGQVLTVLDTLHGKGKHQVALCFQTAPECAVERLNNSAVIIARDNVSVEVGLPGDLDIDLIRAGETGGWVSPQFGVKQATWSIIAQTEAQLPASLKTILEVSQ
jgi:hypothetical protein